MKPRGDGVKHRVARSVVWLIWSRGVVQVMTLVSAALIARLLAPSDYGLLALGNLWIYALSLVADLGLGTAIIQFAEAGDEELNATFWLTMGASGIAALVVWVAAPGIAASFGTPALSTVLRVLSATLPLTTIRLVPEGLLRRRLALDRLAQGNIAVAAITVPVVFGLAWAGAGVWALVSGVIATLIVQAVTAFWFARWWPGVRVGGPHFGAMLRYGSATLGSRLCLTLYQDVADILVLGRVSGTAAVGFYSMAKQLATVPVEKVGVVVNQIASPVMAELQKDAAGLREGFLRAVRVVAWITFPMCVGLMLLGRDFVEVLLTSKWRSLAPSLYPLCLFSMVRSLDMLVTSVLLARYRARALFHYQLVLLVLMPLAFLTGALLGGGPGVAIAWAVAYPTVVLFMAREALRAIDATWGALAAELWPPTLATLTLAGAFVGARWLLPVWPGEPALARLIMMGIPAALAYIAVLTTLGGPIRAEIRQAAGWFIRPGTLLKAAE